MEMQNKNLWRCFMSQVEQHNVVTIKHVSFCRYVHSENQALAIVQVITPMHTICHLL